MQISIEKNEETRCIILKISGDIDTLSASDLEAALNDAAPGCAELILDLSDVRYVSSTGLRSLLFGNKLMKSHGRFALRGVQPDVLEVLEMTGFSELLDIE